jgi:hypothetical protein
MHEILAELMVVDIWQVIDVINCSELEHFSSTVKVNSRHVDFGAGENSLLTVLGTMGDFGVLVTEDEDAIDVIMHLMYGNLTDCMPIYSLHFIKEMYLCGVLTGSAVTSVCQSLTDDVDDRLTNMGVEKMERKIRSASELLNLVGANSDSSA